MIVDGYHIPLKGNQDVIIFGPFPITEEQWQHMMYVLDAMKAGLVWDPHSMGDRPDQ